jgi:hypothetical protein
MDIFIFFPDFCVLKRVILFDERRDLTATGQFPLYWVLLASRHVTHHRPPDGMTDCLTQHRPLTDCSYVTVTFHTGGWTRSPPPPGRRNGTFSSPSRITWRLKSMEASWACISLSPRMNSSVILATSTPVDSGHRPRLTVTRASFKMRSISPDAVYRAHFKGRSLLSSHAAMSSQPLLYQLSQDMTWLL